MTVLSVDGATVTFGTDLIFSGVSFVLGAGERLALVGPNGAGKSTLLRAIMGEIHPDAGRITVAAGCRVAWLTQDPKLGPGNTVEAEAASALAHLQRWEAELRELEQRMASLPPGPDLQEALAAYGRLRTRFEGADGYAREARVKSVLFGLGFDAEQLALPAASLSGGQKVRLGLAKLLLTEPDLMLLDEPTNHLDLDSTEWLEGFLKGSRCTIIVVSHDRYFLDAVGTATLELDRGRAVLFPGNYSRYLVAREERLQQDAEAWRRYQEEAAQLRAYILRYKAGNRATMAKSREKRLERLEALAPERPAGERKRMGLDFDVRFETGEEVVKIRGLTKAYGHRSLFTGFQAEMRRGERVALVGPNGAGKTTLLKILQGQLTPDAGRVWWGVGVRQGYFSQDLDHLDPSRTLLEEMLALPGMNIFQARSLLARFLFSGEVVERPIAELSGGERNRLTLARLMLSGANVLLLDEPTNHLDLESKEVLEEALRDYPGTVLVASHDRYFLDRITTRIWAFGAGSVQDFAGNYSAWRAAFRAVPATLSAPAPAAPAASAPTEAAAGERSQLSGGSPRRERQLREEIRRLEAEIAAAEAKKVELGEALADPAVYRGTRGRELAAEYQALEREIQRLYVAWERAVEQQG